MSSTKLTRRGLMGAGAGLGAAALVGKSAMAAPGSGRRVTRTSNQEEITLNVFVHANHPFDLVKPIYEAKYPNVKLNMMEQNDVAILRAAITAKEGVPDIFWPEIDMVQELGKTGVLLDTTDIVTANKDNLSPGKTAECFIPSTEKYAAFPGDIATVGIYFRQDKLDEAGVTLPDSWTWDEFLEIGKTIKDATGAASLVIPTTGTASSAFLWSFILCQLGGGITNADGTEVTFDNDLGIQAMTIAQKLYQADIAIDEEPFEENYFAEIAAGNVAATPQAVWYRGFGIEPNATDEQGGLGQWRVALLPSAGEGSLLAANLGGAAIASTIYTEHPEEVKNFMVTALGTMEGAEACGQWGILPPYLPYLQSESWNGVRSEAFGEFNFNAVWTQAVEQYPATWYKQPVFGEAMTTIGAGIIPILAGDIDITEGLTALGDQVRELNSRYQ
ncbi:MAG: extracellular solute-binding protein [Thermomicrobiales bacterium]|nr:MAG: extracellular solute-binding protein [Thermomicrobiales bacterium]